MNVFQNELLFFALFCFYVKPVFAQDGYFQNDPEERNKKEISIYLEHPVFFRKTIDFFLMEHFELHLSKKSHYSNPYFSVGFGMGFSKSGIGPYAVPVEFGLISGRKSFKLETGLGIMPVGADVMMKSRFGLRTCFFNRLPVRLSFTPYFMIPYGEREEGEPRYDIKSDVSISVGYRF